jgi:hypothetical protein
MATIEIIEGKAREYSVARGALVELVNGLHNEIEQAKKKYLGAIRKQVVKTKDTESALAALVERSADLFVKPKTLTFHGVKVGFGKLPGKIEFDSADKLVARIERIYKGDETMLEQLLIIKKKPSKEGLEKLDVPALQKLGVSVQDAGERVIVKSVDGEVDKLVAALLKDTDDDAREAA